MIYLFSINNKWTINNNYKIFSLYSKYIIISFSYVYYYYVCYIIIKNISYNSFLIKKNIYLRFQSDFIEIHYLLYLFIYSLYDWLLIIFILNLNFLTIYN